MDAQAAARKAYVQRQLLVRRAVRAVKQTWRDIDPRFIRATWTADVGPRVLRIVAGAQFDAAEMGAASVPTLLTVQGEHGSVAYSVAPAAFAGVASDGSDLASLLELSNRVTLRAILAGATPRQALRFGSNWLGLVVGGQVADAGRTAAGVAVASRPWVQGYIRMLNPPSCDRCIVLAGKFYLWNAGFERHPKCDCIHIPASENADDLRTDPKAYFDSLTEAAQDKAFGKAGAQAIRDGADISQVVNARSGMSTASIGGRKVLTTTSGTSNRGYFAQVQRAMGVSGPRLMPEQIYRIAGNDREEAIRLLAGNGYLVMDVQAAAARAIAL